MSHKNAIKLQNWEKQLEIPRIFLIPYEEFNFFSSFLMRNEKPRKMPCIERNSSKIAAFFSLFFTLSTFTFHIGLQLHHQPMDDRSYQLLPIFFRCNILCLLTYWLLYFECILCPGKNWIFMLMISWMYFQSFFYSNTSWPLGIFNPQNLKAT